MMNFLSSREFPSISKIPEKWKIIKILQELLFTQPLLTPVIDRWVHHLNALKVNDMWALFSFSFLFLPFSFLFSLPYSFLSLALLLSPDGTMAGGTGARAGGSRRLERRGGEG